MPKNVLDKATDPTDPMDPAELHCCFTNALGLLAMVFEENDG